MSSVLQAVAYMENSQNSYKQFWKVIIIFAPSDNLIIKEIFTVSCWDMGTPPSRMWKKWEI